MGPHTFPSTGGSLHQLAVSLLWHPVWAVRQRAAQVVARCHVAVPQFSGAFLDAFIGWLAVLESKQAATKARSESASTLRALRC